MFDVKRPGAPWVIQKAKQREVKNLCFCLMEVGKAGAGGGR